MKLKLRPKTVTRIVSQDGGMALQSAFAIEVLQNRKWTLLGFDENGPAYFQDKAERDSKLEEWQGKEL